MKRLFLALVISLTLITTMCVRAKIDNKRSIALQLNEASGIRSGGLSAKIPFSAGIVNGYASTTAQFAPNVIRGRYHAEAGVTIKTLDFILFTDATYLGRKISALGGENNLGTKMEGPDVTLNGNIKMSYGVGIFGQNAGPFGEQNAFDDLLGLKYRQTDLEQIPGLAALNPVSSGIDFENTNSLKLLIYTELEHPSGWHLGIDAMPEMAGQSEYPRHQLRLKPYISWDLDEAGNFSLDIGADLLAQYQNKKIATDIAFLSQIAMNF